MKRLIAFCLISVCGVMPAMSMSNFESVPPGNWARVESLSQGEEISVKMLFGDKLEGEFLGLDSDAIRLNTNGKERTYPRKDIAEIRLLNIDDSNQNGTGIGVLAGAIPLAILVGKYAENEGQNAFGAAVVAGLIGGGIGGLVGYMVDNLHKGSELIYRAPQQ